jgi:hypothetical protein
LKSSAAFAKVKMLKTPPQKQPSRFDDMMRKISLLKPTKPKKSAKRKK